MAEASELNSWQVWWQKFSLESQESDQRFYQNLNEIRISMGKRLSDFSPELALKFVRLPREIHKEEDVGEDLKRFALEIMSLDQVWSQLGLDEKISWLGVSTGLPPSIDYSIQTKEKMGPKSNSFTTSVKSSVVNSRQQVQGEFDQASIHVASETLGLQELKIPGASVEMMQNTIEASDFVVDDDRQEEVDMDPVAYSISEQESMNKGNSMEETKDQVQVEDAHRVFDGMPTMFFKNSEMRVTPCVGPGNEAQEYPKEIVNAFNPSPENGDQGSFGTCDLNGGKPCSLLLDSPECGKIVVEHQVKSIEVSLGDLEVDSFDFVANQSAHQVFDEMFLRGFNVDNGSMLLEFMVMGYRGWSFDPGGIKSLNFQVLGNKFSYEDLNLNSLNNAHELFGKMPEQKFGFPVESKKYIRMVLSGFDVMGCAELWGDFGEFGSIESFIFDPGGMTGLNLIALDVILSIGHLVLHCSEKHTEILSISNEEFVQIDDLKSGG